MAGYPSDSHVVVHPFDRRLDGDEAIIGNMDRQVFVTIPPEGLDILDALAKGSTVGEAVAIYEKKYNETPDVDDFLGALEDEGFVEPARKSDAVVAPMTAKAPAGPQTKIRWTSHLEWLSVKTCQRIFSKPVLFVMGLVIAGGLALIVIDPRVMPAPNVLVFKENFTLNIWSIVAIMFAGIMVHEFAHVIAARAAGIPARIGIGNRLCVFVIETNMSGIWLAPKRSRYLAYLSGPLVDCFLGTFVIVILFAARHGVFEFTAAQTQWVSAVLWTFISRLMWQCFFFLRTDFYYVFAAATGTKDLKIDTENLLRNLRARLLRIGKRIDQTFIPKRERWAIRSYSLLFVLGNVITLAALAFITVPILIGYGEEIFFLVTGQDTAFSSIDFISLFLLSGLIDGVGLTLWIRSLIKGGSAKRAARRKREARLARDESPPQPRVPATAGSTVS